MSQTLKPKERKPFPVHWLRLAAAFGVVGVFILFFGRSLVPEAPNFDPKPVHPNPSRPITDPSLVSADQANETLDDHELVLGVTIADQSRAYPINMLVGPQRQVINDQLGGRAIVATWCDLCHLGIVYARQVRGRELTFVVSGMVWQQSLVMMDQQTLSLWSHFSGKCMRGPLKGEQLEKIAATVTDWRTWRRHHPQTSILAMTRTSDRFDGEIFRNASRYVVGITSDRKAKAWPLDQLFFDPVVNDSFLHTPVVVVFHAESSSAFVYDRRVDDSTLTFFARRGNLVDEETRTVWSWANGKAIGGELIGKQLKPVAAVVCDRRAWERFHSHSQFWGVP